MKKVGRKPRDQIESLRTKVWYSYVEQCLSRESSYSIEKIFEPDSLFRNSRGRLCNKNKWLKYKKGVNTPEQKLIQQVDEHIQGSASLINSVFWDAIRGQKKLEWFVKFGINFLSWDVKKIVYKTKKNYLNFILASDLNNQDLRRLEKVSGLDSLAAQIIYLRIADSKNDRESALNIGLSIYINLLILCSEPPYLKHAIEIFSLVQTYIFSLANDHFKGIFISDFESIPIELELLKIVLNQCENRNRINNCRKYRIKIMSELLNGEKGEDVRFGLRAPMIPINNDSSIMLKEQRLKIWGLQQLKSGGIEKFAPYHLMWND